MTDLIGAPFTLHGIRVGPELPEAQLARLRSYGFRLADLDGIEPLVVVALFKRLARGQKLGPPGTATGSGTIDDHGLWRKKWNTYEHAWGRFFGAVWLFSYWGEDTGLRELAAAGELRESVICPGPLLVADPPRVAERALARMAAATEAA